MAEVGETLITGAPPVTCTKAMLVNYDHMVYVLDVSKAACLPSTGVGAETATTARVLKKVRLEYMLWMTD